MQQDKGQAVPWDLAAGSSWLFVSHYSGMVCVEAVNEKRGRGEAGWTGKDSMRGEVGRWLRGLALKRGAPLSSW